VPLAKTQLPDKERAFSEFVTSHSQGLFEHVTVTTSLKTTQRSLFQFLRATLFPSNPKPLKITEIPIQGLRQSYHEWNMKMFPSKVSDEQVPSMTTQGSGIADAPSPVKVAKHKPISRPFIHLESLIFHYDPTDSSFSSYGKLVFTLMDFRKAIIEEQEVCHLNINSNKARTEIFALDYTFHKDDLEKIKFCITFPDRDRIFIPGVIWGSLSIIVKMSHQTTAQGYDLQPAQGMYRVPAASLQKWKRNPRVDNAYYDKPEVEQGLRDKFRKKQIIDQTRPADRQDIDYANIAQSDAGSLADRGGDFEEDMVRAPTKEEYQAQQEKMRKSVEQHRRSTMSARSEEPPSVHEDSVVAEEGDQDEPVMNVPRGQSPIPSSSRIQKNAEASGSGAVAAKSPRQETLSQELPEFTTGYLETVEEETQEAAGKKPFKGKMKETRFSLPASGGAVPGHI